MKRGDFNTANTIKQIIHTDFNVGFVAHPEKKDLLRTTNENAVRNSIRALVMTNKYDRPFRPTIGSNINKILFEPMGPETTAMLRTYIGETIRNHEPRAVVQQIEVKENYQRQSYNVTIVFSLINSDRSVTLPLLLEKVR